MAFKIKANDRKPSIQTTLGFVGSATVPTLAGATVVFILNKNVNGAPPATGAPVVKGNCTIVDAATAQVRYDWKVNETATPGKYLAEWQVTGADGLPQTFPTDAYDDVEIFADLDKSA